MVRKQNSSRSEKNQGIIYYLLSLGKMTFFGEVYIFYRKIPRRPEETFQVTV